MHRRAVLIWARYLQAHGICRCGSGSGMHVSMNLGVCFTCRCPALLMTILLLGRCVNSGKERNGCRHLWENRHCPKSPPKAVSPRQTRARRPPRHALRARRRQSCLVASTNFPASTRGGGKRRQQCAPCESGSDGSHRPPRALLAAPGRRLLFHTLCHRCHSGSRSLGIHQRFHFGSSSHC